jgi:hypothetical protein
MRTSLKEEWLFGCYQGSFAQNSEESNGQIENKGHQMKEIFLNLQLWVDISVENYFDKQSEKVYLITYLLHHALIGNQKHYRLQQISDHLLLNKFNKTILILFVRLVRKCMKYFTCQCVNLSWKFNFLKQDANDMLFPSESDSGLIISFPSPLAQLTIRWEEKVSLLKRNFFPLELWRMVQKIFANIGDKK